MRSDELDRLVLPVSAALIRRVAPNIARRLEGLERQHEHLEGIKRLSIAILGLIEMNLFWQEEEHEALHCSSGFFSTKGALFCLPAVSEAWGQV